MYKWPVCPIQGRQLKDVREEDIFGDFRLCNTYRGGGGYDQFPKILCDRKPYCPEEDYATQFVVQLYGCPLNCPYCYVTRDGVLGEHKDYTAKQLVYWFRRSGTRVFHLMGGAPAIYLKHWPEIVDRLDYTEVFHSDLLLIECVYKLRTLKRLAQDNVMLAIDIKGVTPLDFQENTGRRMTPELKNLFWKNFDKVVESDVNFYLTFTNPALHYLERFKNMISDRYGRWALDDHFVIKLVDYEALKDEESVS